MSTKILLEDSATVDDLISLRNALGRERELRGNIALVEGVEKPGTLGAVVDAISVFLVPGGAATVLASSLIAWIRQRTSDISIDVETMKGQRIKIDAKRVRTAAPEEIRKLVDEVGKQLDSPASGPDAR